MRGRVFAIASLMFASCHLPRAGHRTISATIGPEGGYVGTDWGVGLYVPPEALRSTVTFTIDDAVGVPSGALLAFDIGPHGTRFEVPATVFVRLPDGDPFPGRFKVALVVADRWEALPGYASNDATREVSGETGALAVFGLVESQEECANGADEDGDGLIDCADSLCASECQGRDGGSMDASVDVDAGMGDAGPLDRPDASGGTDGGLEAPDAGDMPDDAGTDDGGRTCRNDHQCEEDEVCEDGICVQAPEEPDSGTLCRNDHQCDDELVCLDGACVSEEETDGGELPCTADADCPTALRCRGGRCR